MRDTGNLKLVQKALNHRDIKSTLRYAHLLTASLIAGLATTPYAAFHFHRITPYGVVANLAAMPVVSALVMPAGLLGLVAMPFGFDDFFWWLMGVGIDWMITVARWVAGFPGAVGRMAAFGTGPLIVASLGIILVGLLRTPLRWSGAGVLLLAIVWAVSVPRPDILISGDGRNVAVRGKDGRLHLMRGGKDAFAVKEWLAADADARTATEASLADGVSCDGTGCVTQAADGALVALSLRPEAIADDCERAALIVTARQAPASCRASVIDAERLRRQGALTLRSTNAGFAVDAVKPRGIDRPWSPSAGGEPSDSETTIFVSRPARQAVDATPSEADMQADESRRRSAGYDRTRRKLLGIGRLRCDRSFLDRKLQHGHALALAKLGHQHERAVGEFDRVMVTVRDMRIDHAELADPVFQRFRPDPAAVEADILGECQLGARQHADRGIGIAF